MQYQLNRTSPIAVFDSGMGGISVLRELVRVMPQEDYIFFGDSANAPYGIKTKEQVKELTCTHVRTLLEEGAKGIVIACNTATSAAVRSLREMYPQVPIVGIEPAVKPAASCAEHPRVLVMATPMTIREEKFQNLVRRFEDQAEILQLSCPGLMDFVERGELGGSQLQRYLDELLYAYRMEPVDAVVLGCTHYPFVKDAIAENLAYPVQFFDGAPGTAREMKRRLAMSGLLNPSRTRGHIEFRNSLPNQEKMELYQKLLNMDGVTR